MQVVRTNDFIRWLNRLRDEIGKARIESRILRAERDGHLGVTRALGGELFEMKMTFGPGYRMYYAIRGTTIVYLLGGGDKSTQADDIRRARELLKELEVAGWPLE